MPFHVGATQYTQQFANLYFSRLKQLAPVAMASARAAWGASLPFVKTLDAEVGELVGVVGTLFAELGGKPDIMKEVTRDILAEKPVEQTNGLYGTGEGDTFYLEDDSGRIALSGPGLSCSNFPFATGAVIAVRGKLEPDGTLHIDEVCLPGAPPAARTAIDTSIAIAADKGSGDSHAEGDKYVALVSGLHIGASEVEPLPLMLLTDYLTGYVGSPADLAVQASIVRLIICGNSTVDTSGNGTAAGAASVDALKKLERSEQRSLAECMSSLDSFLTSVSAAMPVDLMPGTTDPCNYLLPQQPLHPCMLPQASRLSSLSLRTNPYACVVDGVPILGTSGQPIEDFLKYAQTGSETSGVNAQDHALSALRRSLELRHLAPTAPDTLGCYPFATSDPFVMETSPSLYFAGNQPGYATELACAEGGEPVRLVTVPDFSSTHSIVLVNLRTLGAHQVAFGAGAASETTTVEV